MNPHKHLDHPPSEKVKALAARLVGSCDSAADELDALSFEECGELDALAFCCEGCGWWFSGDDCHEDDGWFCGGCVAERANHN